jgi:predicted membrane-bound dolichyl-phosphate-mannose-protein mannosyltransferase
MIKAIIKKVKASLFIPNIVYVLVLGFMVRLLLSGFGTLHLDQGTFIAWSVNLAENGLTSFYSGWSDYLPGYLYILWFLGKVRGLIPDTLLYKIPAILADLTTAYLIYKILKGKKGLIGAAIYVLNPAVFANSALWGQVDSFTALLSLLSVYFIPGSYILSAVSLAVGTLIKPQVAFVFPVIIFLFVKNKFNFRKITIYLMVGLLVFLAGFLPFQNQPNFASFVLGRLTLSANQYPYTAVNAFSFWGLFGQWKPDNLYYQLGGYLAFIISTFLFARKVWSHKNFKFLMAGFIFIFSFMFFTRMHERHLLPIFAPLTILVAGEFIYLIPLVGFSIVYLLNLYYAYSYVTFDFKLPFEPFPVIILALVSFFAFLFISLNFQRAKSLFKSMIGFFNKGRKFVPDDLPKLTVSKTASVIIISLILLFSLTTRIYKIGEPPKDYFDEIYHAFTARLVLHNDPKAWEWWNPHPEGFAYEWTHPPFSKLIMAGGMLVFGENATGWRIPQALFGTLSVFLVYLLAKKIFKDEWISLLAAGIFSLDGLSLVLSRMGMNDIYVLTFMLLSIYFFMKGKDFFAAISLGLTIASKWSGIWTVPILFLLWLRRKNKFQVSTFLCFIILPIAIYLATYTQMFTTGHDLGTWWGMQKQMWWYHTGLNATHPYTSSWWSWPLMERPVYLYTSDEVNGFVSRIYAIGNPLVFWFGLISIFLSLIYSYFEKNKKLALIVFSYLIFFVPWAASPRIMFLYHYLPSIPFMCMGIAYFLRRNTKLIIPTLALIVVSFAYFYPHWAGLSIPLWLDKSYYWIPSWR